MCKGLILYSIRQQSEREHIVDHRAHVDRDSSLRNDAARHLVHEHMLIPRRIKIVQQEQLQLRLVFQQRSEDRSEVCVFGLHGQVALLRARGPHGKAQAGDHLFRMAEHEMPVRLQNGLALRAVGDDKIRLGLYFNMHGKACAARADDAGRFGAGRNIPRGYLRIIRHFLNTPQRNYSTVHSSLFRTWHTASAASSFTMLLPKLRYCRMTEPTT